MHHGAEGHDLLYVSNQGGPNMLVFSYPEGRLFGQLRVAHYPFGLCVDGSQNVWIAGETDLDTFNVSEYAHGTTHRKASVRDKTGAAIGCAIDPTTGDLAVVNQTNASSRQGNITVHSFADKSDKVYTNPKLYYYRGATYDGAGNLFAAGIDDSSAPVLAELPHNSGKFVTLKMNAKIYDISGVLWDGKYVVVGSAGYAVLYRFTISGSRAVFYDKVSLPGEAGTTPSIVGARAIGGDFEWNLFYWRYPDGGTTKNIRSRRLSEPAAVVLSRAQ